MNILLTGANGYIGSNILKELLKLKHNIFILIRKSSNLELIKNDLNEVKIYSRETDLNILINEFKNKNIDCIVHLAAKSLYNHSSNEIYNLIDSNITFGVELLEIAKQANIKYFINTTTYWQHYNGKEYCPVNLYASMKEAFEKIIQFYTFDKKITAMSLELYDNYGPNDPREKLVNYLINQIKNKVEINISPGEQEMNLLYVCDVVSGFITALKNILKQDAYTYKKYTLANDTNITVKELVEKLIAISSINVTVNYGFYPYRTKEIMKNKLFGKILPNWEPKVKIEKGLKKLLEHREEEVLK